MAKSTHDVHLFFAELVGSGVLEALFACKKGVTSSQPCFFSSSDGHPWKG